MHVTVLVVAPAYHVNRGDDHGVLGRSDEIFSIALPMTRGSTPPHGELDFVADLDSFVEFWGLRAKPMVMARM